MISKWLVVASLLVGCKDRTELMIGVATDLRAPDALDTAQLVVSRTSDGVVQQQLSWDISGVPSQPFNLPGSFGVFTDGDEPQVDIELGGFKNGSQLVSRHAVLSLIEGQTLFLRLTVVAACANRTDCTDNQSCVEGQCVDRLIDARRLPDFTETLVTELTCQSGTTYIDTSTGDPMPLSADAAMCPGDRCFEGTCLEPPPGTTTGGSDGGTDPKLPPNPFVIASQTLPTSTAEARNLGLDLDGDGMVNNQMGMVIATFVGQGLPSQPGLDTAIAKGQALTLVDLGAQDFANGPGTFASFFGANPQPPACNGGGDMVCGHHLQGTGTFDIAATSPANPPLVGTITNGVLAAGPNNLVLHTALLDAVVPLQLIGGRVKVTSISASALTGVIAGAITMTDVDTNIIPAWASRFTTEMLADCPGSPPGCGCTASSRGATLHGLFDTAPADCTISATEVRNNSLMQSLLAPDVQIGGQSGLSIGVGFTAVPATFPLPP